MGTVHRAEAVLWIPAHGALAAGDILLGTSEGGVRVCPDSWLRPGVTGVQVREGLQRLLELTGRTPAPRPRPAGAGGRSGRARAGTQSLTASPLSADR